MSMTDPIADLLTRIRNANAQKHSQLQIPASKVKIEIVRALKESRMIQDYEVTHQGIQKSIRVHLRYMKENVPVITGLRRISKPGLRVYISKDRIASMEKGIGTVILSTSRGVMTGRAARQAQIGGEVICRVW